jgi:pre-60S factor REI1
MACHVAFESGNMQRGHYQTEWHRYNLKRKIAELPPLSLEAFQLRMDEQVQQDVPTPDDKKYCTVCRYAI